MGPDEKLMMEKMGFSNFTAKWQTNLEEKEEVEVKEERHTFRFEVFISAQLKENMFNAFFRCLVCDLELNSEDTYASHVRGVRHVVSILGKYALSHPGQTGRKMRSCNRRREGRFWWCLLQRRPG